VKRGRTIQERPTQEWKDEHAARIAKKILRGDYSGALPIAKSGWKQYPRDVFCRFQYAKILGDWADELPATRKRKLKREAIAILRPLLRSLRGEAPKTRFGICLNYYYQSEDFPGMVRFGRRLAARKDRQGFYAIGIGSALEGMRRRKTKPGLSRSCARRSLQAWVRYDLKKEKYYFPHYIEAMAFGLLGEKEKGLHSLKRAARASGRRVTDWEFADVRALFDEKSHLV